MNIEQIKLKNGTALALKFEMCSAPLLVIKAEKGFAMCGYLDIGTANKLNDTAVKVIDVKDFEEMLNARVKEVSEKAKEIGITLEMTVRDALERMF